MFGNTNPTVASCDKTVYQLWCDGQEEFPTEENTLDIIAYMGCRVHTVHMLTSFPPIQGGTESLLLMREACKRYEFFQILVINRILILSRFSDV